MFGIGSTELLIILVVALLILGPKKLPEIARSLGKGMAEFRRMSNDVKRTIDLEVDKADEEERHKKTKKEMFPEEKSSKTQEPEQQTGSGESKGKGETGTPEEKQQHPSGTDEDQKQTAEKPQESDGEKA